ncbi:MAG: BRO-N domain-containing protein [Candidatus Desulforudaceae bacterium]
MNQLQRIFTYQGTQVRTVVIDGQIWFVAKDVCDILEIINPTDAVSRLDDDERTLVSIEGASNGLPVNAVTEPGLYSLVLGSRKPEARAFKRWVTHEVLPSIRQTGTYHVIPMTPTQALLRTVELLAVQEQQIQQLTEKTDVLAHRIDNLDAVNTIGDPQQRLNAMVRKYAQKQGVYFNKAWADFVQAYNTAYRTNLKLLQANYEMKHGRKVTVPQFLAITGSLEDGIRVADKMLNDQTATG